MSIGWPMHENSVQIDLDIASEKEANSPDFTAESRLTVSGLTTIAGVDEAGRGPLAGPVVAAACILDVQSIPKGLNDSKKISEADRETLFELIVRGSHIAWSAANSDEIDIVNIRQASLNAMVRAVRGLAIEPDHALIDGRDIPAPLIGKATAMIKGDGRSLSIAAASIVAKVIRDRMMRHADSIFPDYGFSKHKGYGTAHHLKQIEKHGPCPLHRRSFAPIAKYL